MDINIWKDMFAFGLPVLEKILRPVIVYVFLIVGLRLAGKRELAQLNTFDLVVLLTLSNTVQNAIIGNDNSLSGGLVGATTLLALNYVVVRFLYAHEKIDKIVEGNTDILIEHGKLNKENLKKELITLAELESAAHRQGFPSLDDIERAAIEAGGTITFVAKTHKHASDAHKEIMHRLDQILNELAELRTSQQSTK